MNKQLTVFVASLVVLFGAGIFAWKQWIGAAGVSASASHAAAAPRSEDGVMAAYRLLEKANREGDGELLLSLQTHEATAGMTDAQRSAFPKRFPPDPGLHYVPLAAGASGSHGAVIARIEGSTRATGKYESVKLVLEDGSWKVDRESFDDSPLDARGLYALLPPEDGAFARAGSPWAAVPYSVSNTQFFKESELDWKMKATRDESFLYVRFEAKSLLPAPGTEMYKDKAHPESPVDTGVPPPPVMKIKLDEAGAGTTHNEEFSFQASDVLRTRATFDKIGKANSNRFFVVYALSLRSTSDATILDTNTDDTVAQMVAVNDRFFDLKIPLKSLGVEGNKSAITLQEANSFAKILPYQVAKFAPQ
jgi:hypothetical protein